MEQIQRLASQNGLVIFSKSSCSCMCHAIKTLFDGLGAHTVVYELDNGPVGRVMERELVRLMRCNPPVPAVFVGGKPLGTADKVNQLHIEGRLIPMLGEAGVIWVWNQDQYPSRST